MIRAAILALASCILLTACGDTIKGKSVAEPEIGVFHQRLNQRQFEEIYAAAGDEFRNAAPKEKALELFSAIDRKLGPAKSWKTTGWNVNTFNFTTTVVLVEDTAFEKGQGTEKFTFKVSGDKATLAGYNISSLDMMIK